MPLSANTANRVAVLLALLLALIPAANAQQIINNNPSLNSLGGANIGLTNTTLPGSLNALTANLTGQTFYANAYGSCTWDATHDVGPCINSAITAAYNGGNVLGYVSIPAGTFGVSTTISQTTTKGISIVGAGGGGQFAVCNTNLKWIGSAAGTIVSLNPSGQAIVGGGLRRLCIDGNNALAGTGIFARGVVSAWFEDVEVRNTSVTAWDIDAVDGTNGGFQDNNFIHDNIFQLVAGSASANGWQIGQGATATGNDTYRNHWIGGLVQYQNGTAFLIGATDSNTFVDMTAQLVSGGTGKSIDCLGSSVSALLACRSNKFITDGGWGGSAAGSAPTFETNTFPSLKNYVYQNEESGALLPVRNGAATLTYDTNFGQHFSNAISPIATIAVDLPQAVGGSALLALASTTGAVVGQQVSGTNVPAGDTVSSIVSTAQVTLTANGVSNSGQKVLTTTATTGSAAGQQCTDLTTPTAIGAGNVIASIQAGVSITLTTNLVANTANSDSIVCDPVVTLATPTSTAVTAATSINFYTNRTTLSQSSFLVDPGDASIYGSLVTGGPITTSNTTASTSGATGAITSGGGIGAADAVWAGTFIGISGTTLPTQAAGTLGLGGVASAPTMAANGEGAVYLTAGGGLTLQGSGSGASVTLATAAGTGACTVSSTAVFGCSAGMTGVNIGALGSGGNFYTNGTGALSPAAGYVQVAGAVSVPTFAANSEGAIFLTSTTGGLSLMGKGSTNDLTVYNAAGTSTCVIPTGTTNYSCGAFLPTGSTAPTVGMALPAAGKLGLYGTTSELFSGATDVLDYGVTTSSVLTLPVATTLSNASVAMPGIASSAAALDAVCWNAGSSPVGILTHNAAGALCSASLEELKDIFDRIDPGEALNEVMALKPIWAKYKDSVSGTSDHAVHPMFGAHQVESVDPRLSAYDGDGHLSSVEYLYMSALNTAAIQAQQRQIEALKILALWVVLFCALVYVRQRAGAP